MSQEQKIDTRSMQPAKFLMYTNKLVHDSLRYIAFLQSTIENHTSMSTIATSVLTEALPSYMETMTFNYKKELDDEQIKNLLKLKKELEKT